jgi:hypothetical protein
MRTRNLRLEYVADDVDADSFERGAAKDKHYARSRSARSPRRRSTRSTTSSAPLGIAARRKRRWAW